MSDASLLVERLESVLEALERIPRRLADVPTAGACKGFCVTAGKWRAIYRLIPNPATKTFTGPSCQY